MEKTIQRVQATRPIRLTVIDISTDEGLEHQYGERIPLLCIDGRVAFKYRVIEDALARRLDRTS